MSRRLKSSLLAGAACIIALAPGARAASAAGMMKRGLENYAAGDHLVASTNFQAAAELAAGQDRDPARAWLNAGNALYRAGELERADESYRRALDSDNPGLQARVFHNLGNIVLKRSQRALKEGEASTALNLYERAKADYEKAIVLDPAYLAPKYNYELAGRRKYNLLAKVDQLRADMEKARRQARAAEYASAFAMLQKRAPEHEIAFQLEPELKKQYEQLTRKIGQIVGIVKNAEGKTDV